LCRGDAYRNSEFGTKKVSSACNFLYQHEVQNGSGILLACLTDLARCDLPRSCTRPRLWAIWWVSQAAGGLAILTGVLIRIGAGCVIAVMLGAIFPVHPAHEFDINKGGVEYGLTQLLMALALSLAGAGRYSLAASLPACPENSKRKQKALRIGNSRRAQKEYLLGKNTCLSAGV